MSRWFRMYDDVINDPKVMRLPPEMRWHWVSMLCAASKNDGSLPALPDLAFSLRLGEFEVSDIVNALVAAGLFDDVGGALCPHNWDGRQYKSDSSTDRVRAFRERNASKPSTVTSNKRNVSCNVSGNVSETRSEQKQIQTETNSRSIASDQPGAQIDLEEVIAAKAPKPAKAPRRAAEPSRFDEFWQAYPRRDGPNPRAPAETRFNALVKTGLDPEMLIAEAKKLAVAENARGNIGTRFIPQAVTWLNQSRWTDHAAVAALAELSGPLAIEEAVKMYAKTRHWSRHAASPAPGEPGCKASVELLARHGLDQMGRKIEVEPV